MPLAHAGGVDEIAFLLLPAVVFFFVLQLRRKHVTGKDDPRGDEPDDGSDR